MLPAGFSTGSYAAKTLLVPRQSLATKPVQREELPRDYRGIVARIKTAFARTSDQESFSFLLETYALS